MTDSTGERKPSMSHVDWWNANIKPEFHTISPPLSLEKANTRDKEIMSQAEDKFASMSWPEIKDIIATNRIDLFQRSPLELRRYLHYIHDIQKRYTSVADFVRLNRLNWPSDTMPAKKRAPGPHSRFNDPTEYRILRNDWPYNVGPRVTHLVVWTQFVLEDDEKTGLLQPWVTEELEKFVRKTFVKGTKLSDGRDDRLPRENVVWFKNWASIKSVAQLEHFHVMVLDPDPAFVDRVTGGDVSASWQLQQRISDY